MAPKAMKFRRALKSAARFPVRGAGTLVGGGRGSGRNTLSPITGEDPIVILRLQILGCKGMLAKDRNGASDPFIVVSMLNSRFQTPVAKKTLQPIYAPKDATFDFPIYLSLADRLGVLEMVAWDKDMLMKKDYMGEVALPLEDWFTDDRPYGFDEPATNTQPFSLNLVSTRDGIKAAGSVQVKLGFVSPPKTQNLLEFDEIFSELIRRSRPSLVSAPPTEGVGTVRSHAGVADYEDDGGISSDSDSDSSDDEEFADALDDNDTVLTPTVNTASSTPATSFSTGLTSPLTPTNTPASQEAEFRASPPQLNLTPATPVASPPNKRLPSPKIGTPSPSFMRMKFSRRSTSTSNPTSETSDTGTPPGTPGSGSSSTPGTSSGSGNEGAGGRMKRKKQPYSFSGPNDIVGIVMLEIKSAEDLPKLKNMTRTGWDMDPFVVISFGKKVFRTRVIRHSLSPVWDEKLLFHVRRYETAFKVQLTILDWDKLSSNDHIGDASFDLKELLDNAPQADEETGLYPFTDEDQAMSDFKLPLTTGKDMPWESKHAPVISVRAMYQPYAALRQRFWRQFLKQYDTDDTETLSHIEITSMLDSLGSTLTRLTVNSFWTRFNKNSHTDELTIAEAIQCLEAELGRPDSEKKRLDADDALLDSSVSATPMIMISDREGNELPLDHLDFSGPPMSISVGPETNDVVSGTEMKAQPSASGPYTTEPAQQPLAHAASGTPMGEIADPIGGMARQGSYSSSEPEDDSSGSDESFERVINVKNCPLCHRPRLNSKAEVDIITHLAVCASQDWNKVDRIVVGNFVTASQAQRKWYTKIIGKISSGDYKLGANSANIIVQNRMTGQLEEEKMQVYVRLGIRLLYKGAKGRMEGNGARRLLKSLSIKQGIKYDAPESARDIPTFIEFHGLKVDEILDPLGSFKSFNEFFYRKLKPSARPIEKPKDPYRLVSAADCRLMAFETVSEATRLWIKGREFTVSRLLGDAYKDQAERYNGGALAIFRLAPQDYHRFHSPVEGKIGPMKYIAGEYYTVNPQAIRTALDVYGENARKIVPIDSPHFGRVMAVCVGAMMVGTIATTVNEGDYVQRGQEFGYFAFGGSTIVILFEKGAVEWDEDLLINGRAALETLVRVGMGIGTGVKRG
ncbi:phosphatidylserine decarboxylase-domain-containing protein [Desarmillaria tabescens]|uniref:Phosphatidylserine decarboxylase proenzyme 2 n=1 Tax=Armillaria tabescens TaxID=1929756 RepID=A0AA39U2L0_ARMTA|nr:phosphatidylserine decarboxylase-domain-containing protein [Desarmillaria tabescens]KAK0469409.1 phosphatidylserine decarboxylase-domain-containing protein [Desarmillaria tabescens]